MKLSLLQRLALFARHRYRTVFVGLAVLVVLSAILISRLSFDTDMLNLLPREDPGVRTYVETLQDFGSSTYLLVAIRIPEGAVVEPYETLVDRLAGRLARLPELKSVQHRIGEPRELLETFYPKALLFLDDAGRKQLEERLSDRGIERHVSELRRQLTTPQGMAAKDLFQMDPFGLSDVFLQRLQSSRGSLRVDWTSGYYLSRDQRLLLILAEPVRPPQDIEFVERLAAEVDRVIAEAKGEWGEIAGREKKAPEVVAGGPHLTALGDAALIRKDMLLNLGTAVPSVLLFFWFTFRRPGSVLYAVLPMIAGLALTFGFAELAIGSLSSATSVVAALLAGLGIDFVIVSYGRYVEERQKGASLEDGLLAMAGSTGRAVLVGAVTTTVTFWAFIFTRFSGLRQMGLLTGTGILFCVLSVFLLLPAMLAWSEDHHHSRQKRQPTLFLHSFGSEGLMRLSLHHPWITCLIGLAITLAMLALAMNIEFDESMKTMRPKGNRGIDVASEVGNTFGSGFDSMMVILTGETPEQVIELSGRAAHGAQRMVDTGTLYGFSGVTSLIPPPSQQREALAWIERERKGALDLDRIRSTFARAAAAEGLRAESFAPGLDLLTEAVGLAAPVGYGSFQDSPQTRLLLERYLKKTDRGWKGAVYLYPLDNRWRREPPPDALHLVQKLGPQAALSGTNVVNQRVRALVLEDVWIASLVGLVLVAALIWIDFHSLTRTLAALAPLTVGLIWMVGAMVLVNTPMNFINIFVTTMIIGIGVDYGVHVLHRFQEVQDYPRAEFEKGVVETGKAVVAASISTIFGFGSIMFSHYPGLQSTGKVAILGALTTCLVAITLVPAILSWRYEQRRRKGIPVSLKTAA